MSTTRKRAFVSGHPWWFVTPWLTLWALFALISFVVPSPNSREFQYTLVVMVVGFLIYRFSSPQVYLDDSCLWISRYGRTVAVPLEHVADIEETTFKWPSRPHSAVLHFTTDTPFGRSLYLGSFGALPSMILPSALKELRRALEEVAAKRSNQAMERTADRIGSRLKDEL